MLKLVPIVSVEPFRDLESMRRNPFGLNLPNPSNHRNSSLTNCGLHHTSTNTITGGNAASHHHHQYQNSSPLSMCIWTFFWLAMLIFVAYPIGLISGQLYILISPISTVQCFHQLLQPLLTTLLNGLHLPLMCTDYMIMAKPLIFI